MDGQADLFTSTTYIIVAYVEANNLNTIDIYVNCNETIGHNKRMESGAQSERCMKPLIELFRGTPYLRIIKFMAMHEKNTLFTVRKISRNIKMNHKNILKYLETLDSTGLIEVAYSESNLRLYRLTEKGLLVGESLVAVEEVPRKKSKSSSD